MAEGESTAAYKHVEGFLVKRGHIFKNWKRRFFVLDKDSLLYYKHAGDTKPRGRISLEKAELYDDGAPGLKSDKEHLFSVATPRKVYHIQAASAVEKMTWLAALSTNTGLCTSHAPSRTTYLSRAMSLAESLAAEVEDVPQRDSIRVFAGSWNMAEQSAPENIGDWIPLGRDIYAVGLQECMEARSLRVRIRDLLGPGFIEVHHRIGQTMTGLGYHGHIALVVYVKEWLVNSGICQCSRAVRSSVSLGRNLVVTRASNKGGVCVTLPLLLPDASGTPSIPTAFSFVTCHLASDLHGLSRLHVRNRDALDMLRELGFWLPPHKDRGPRAPVPSRMPSSAWVAKDRLSAPREEPSREDRAATMQPASSQVRLSGVSDADAVVRSESWAPDAAGDGEQVVTRSREPSASTPHRAPDAYSSAPKQAEGGAAPSPAGAAAGAEAPEPELPVPPSVDERFANDQLEAIIGVPTHQAYVFVCGDLNYRLDLTPEQALNTIPRAADDPNQHTAWLRLLAHDQLYREMRRGASFFKFQEAPIMFPPTYRRKKDPSQALRRSAGDYTSLDKVRRGFTTVVKKRKSLAHAAGVDIPPEELRDKAVSKKDSKKQARTPSYTDRILLREPVRFEGHAPLPAVLWEAYDQCDEVTGSDHTPVMATFTVPLGAASAHAGDDHEAAAGGVTQRPLRRPLSLPMRTSRSARSVSMVVPGSGGILSDLGDARDGVGFVLLPRVVGKLDGDAEVDNDSDDSDETVDGSPAPSTPPSHQLRRRSMGSFPLRLELSACRTSSPLRRGGLGATAGAPVLVGPQTPPLSQHSTAPHLADLIVPVAGQAASSSEPYVPRFEEDAQRARHPSLLVFDAPLPLAPVHTEAPPPVPPLPPPLPEDMFDSEEEEEGEEEAAAAHSSPPSSVTSSPPASPRAGLSPPAAGSDKAAVAPKAVRELASMVAARAVAAAVAKSPRDVALRLAAAAMAAAVVRCGAVLDALEESEDSESTEGEEVVGGEEEVEVADVGEVGDVAAAMPRGRASSASDAKGAASAPPMPGGWAPAAPAGQGHTRRQTSPALFPLPRQAAVGGAMPAAPTPGRGGHRRSTTATAPRTQRPSLVPSSARDDAHFSFQELQLYWKSLGTPATAPSS